MTERITYEVLCDGAHGACPAYSLSLDSMETARAQAVEAGWDLGPEGERQDSCPDHRKDTT